MSTGRMVNIQSASMYNEQIAMDGLLADQPLGNNPTDGQMSDIRSFTRQTEDGFGG